MNVMNLEIQTLHCHYRLLAWLQEHLKIILIIIQGVCLPQSLVIGLVYRIVNVETNTNNLPTSGYEIIYSIFNH